MSRRHLPVCRDPHPHRTYLGINADLDVDRDVLVIRQKSMFGGKTHGPRTIPLKDISAVGLQPAARYQMGWLQIATLGADATITDRGCALRDAQTVLFDQLDAPVMRGLAGWLDRVVAANREAGRPVPDPSAPADRADRAAHAAHAAPAVHAAHAAHAVPPRHLLPDALEQLRRLGDLRDSGVLTTDEFTAKKSELLARL